MWILKVHPISDWWMKLISPTVNYKYLKLKSVNCVIIWHPVMTVSSINSSIKGQDLVHYSAGLSSCITQ